jgi:hypothetical protein
VVTLRATTDAATQALIKDIIATTGGVPDRAGGEGVNAAKIDAFFAEVESYLKWIDATASKNVPELGSATAAASSALRAVRPKVDDYFARCRLAAFDGRATAALNRQETEYLAIAARDLTITAAEVAGFPLARVDPAGRLPLLDEVNPAWRGALATLHKIVVTPLFGAAKTSLTMDDWAAITAKFAPFENWIGAGAPSPIEKLGAARAKELLESPAREALAELVELRGASGPLLSRSAHAAAQFRELRRFLLARSLRRFSSRHPLSRQPLVRVVHPRGRCQRPRRHGADEQGLRRLPGLPAGRGRNVEGCGVLHAG